MGCSECEENRKLAEQKRDPLSIQSIIKSNGLSQEAINIVARTRVSIGMAVCGEHDSAMFTIQALRMNHGLNEKNAEIIVVDNDPAPNGKTNRMERFCHSVGGKTVPVIYEKFSDVKGTSAPRNHIFKIASGDIVIVCDPHILIQPGSLTGLFHYSAAFPDKHELWHANLMSDTLIKEEFQTHMEEKWGDDLMYGTWGHDSRGESPQTPAFDIPMHGLGLFACRREDWIDWPHGLSGFGGEEGCVHELWRQNGRKVVLLPFMRYWHLFRDGGNGTGAPYEVSLVDRLQNYLIWYDRLGRDPNDVVEIFRNNERCSRGIIDQGINKFIRKVPQWSLNPFSGLLQNPSKVSTGLFMPVTNIAKMAWNYTSALIRHARDGFEHVTEETFKARVSACDACPHRKEKSCGVCLCPIETKALWKSEDCPDNPSRWKFAEGAVPVHETVEQKFTREAVEQYGKNVQEMVEFANQEVQSEENAGLDIQVLSDKNDVNLTVITDKESGEEKLRAEFIESGLNCTTGHRNVACSVSVDDKKARFVRVTGKCKDCHRTLFTVERG